MKKKIVSLCLVVAMAAIAIVGGTLAYLTDRDQVENTFTVGKVDIDLYEKTDAWPDLTFQNNLDYSNIMPGNVLSKKPIVENTGENPAYVRVAVVMNHVEEINRAIDSVYEEKYANDEDKADKIQAIYDEVFDGWGVNYNKRNGTGRRMWMDDRTSDSKVLCNIDTFALLRSAEYGTYGMHDYQNQFQSETEKWRTDGFTYGSETSYYSDCVTTGERVYVFYLKLAPNETYQLFDGLKVPADFNAAQLAMFDGLTINIYADAIQAEGFEDTTDENGNTIPAYVNAFNALQDANPLGWWKHN